MFIVRSHFFLHFSYVLISLNLETGLSFSSENFGMSDTNTIRTVVLEYLDSHDVIANSREFANSHKFDHDAVVGAINSLQAKEMITTTSSSTVGHVLKDEGIDFIKNGSYEYRIYRAVPEDGISREELEVGFFNPTYS